MRFQINGTAVVTGGPDDRLLPWERVQDMAGISRTTAWRMQQTGTFPAPVPVSPGRVGWWESELTAWKRTRGDVKAPTAPGRPRLPGMPRRSRKRETPVVPEQVVVSTPPIPAVALPQRVLKKRGSRRASPDQIDFGF